MNGSDVNQIRITSLRHIQGQPQVIDNLEVKALGISPRTLHTLTHTGQVPHVRLGKRVLYPVEALRTWLAEQAKTPKEE